MSHLNVIDRDDAPQASRPTLDHAQQTLGFVPNLYGVFAAAPAALKAYTQIDAALKESSLTPAEQQIVLLSVSFENECEYCMAAHSKIAAMSQVPEDVIQELRDGQPLSDDKQEALRTFTRAVVKQRGNLEPSQVQAFLDAGYSRANILEVLVGVAQKTLSNYTNHLAETPVDDAFQEQAWSRPQAGDETAVA